MVDIAKLGARRGPDRTVLDPAQGRAYAAATNDDGPAYRSGRILPPVFGVVPTWETMMAVVMDVVQEGTLGRLVHRSHDMHFHRPLIGGSELVTEAELSHVRALGPGVELTIAVCSRSVAGEPILDQYATMFIWGSRGGQSGGREPPDHRLSPAARASVVCERIVHVDPDQTYRYRDASGDTNPIHVDESFAKQVGLPGIILQGLCTMAMCSHTVVADAAGNDPRRVRRLAVRFSRPVLPGKDLVTTLYDLGELNGNRSYGLEARSEGQVVVKDGLAVVGT